MSLAAVWGNYERPDHPTLWMASDSRISDGSGPLIDEGMKLFEIPVICRGPGKTGFFDEPFIARSVGMVAVGGTLIFQHVYASMVTMLGSLIGVTGPGPTNLDIAEFLARVTTIHVHGLGLFRPREASRIGIAVGGVSEAGEIEAYELIEERDVDGRAVFVPRPFELGPGSVNFMGDDLDRARRLCVEIRERDEPGAPKERAALNVIRAVIDDPAVKSVGGEVQVGLTIGASFRRMFSVRPLEVGRPEARMAFNAIDLAELKSVGPYQVAPLGMATP